MVRKQRHGTLLFITIALFLIIPNFLIQFVLLLYILVNLFSLLHSRLTRRMIGVKRNFLIARTYRSEHLEVVVSIENRSIFSVQNLFVSDSPGKLFIRGQSNGVFTLRARQQSSISYSVFGDKRGHYSLGPVRMTGADPLSLYPWTVTVPNKADVIIYPHVFALNLVNNRGLPSGAITVTDPVYEDITSFKSIREYIPGDDLKRVNWKVSARLGSLYTMQYTPSLSYSAIVLLNLVEEDYPLRYRFSIIEYSIEIAASLIHACIAAKQEAGILCDGVLDGAGGAVSFPVNKEPVHAVRILETLARIASTPEKKDVVNLLFDAPVTIPFACRLFYVGPPLLEKQLDRLSVLKRKGIKCEFFLTVKTRDFARKLAGYGFPCHDIDTIRMKSVL